MPLPQSVRTNDRSPFFRAETISGGELSLPSSASHDDPVDGGPQSTIPAGSLTLAAGYYDLLITGSGRYAASAGGAIFPNYTDGSTDPTGVYGPTGPGGASPFSNYFGNSSEGGRYSIALTGAQFVAAVTAVPEPSAVAMFFTGFALLLAAVRRRPSSHSNASTSLV